MAKIAFGIRLEPSLESKIREMAREKNISRSQFIRSIMQEYLESCESSIEKAPAA